MTDHEKQVEQIVDLLECSIAEAEQVIADDTAINKMGVRECESDLTTDQKEYAKKYRQGDRKPTLYKFNQRERKADATKGDLISLLAAALNECESVNNLEITNAERQIDFLHNDRKMRIVLSAPRK